jgi:putative ABC transport system ATP-binding protein
MSTNQPLIQINAMSKVFLTDEVETRALAAIDFSINKGEYVSITGPSGCGKSTLLSILGMLDAPSEGSYVFNGTAVHAMKAGQRAKIRNREIGFIFQAFNLIGDLTIFQNVELPLIFRGDIGKAERAERVNQALEQVGMGHRAKHHPAQLSGGQQQRVAVARALAGQPAILLADEPTGNLDSRNGEAVMRLLDDLHAAGSTICVVTHDVRYAEAAARQISMFDGKIVDAATLQRMRNEESAQLEAQRQRARRPAAARPAVVSA